MFSLTFIKGSLSKFYYNYIYYNNLNILINLIIVYINKAKKFRQFTHQIIIFTYRPSKTVVTKTHAHNNTHAASSQQNIWIELSPSHIYSIIYCISWKNAIYRKHKKNTCIYIYMYAAYNCFIILSLSSSSAAAAAIASLINSARLYYNYIAKKIRCYELLLYYY